MHPSNNHLNVSPASPQGPSFIQPSQLSAAQRTVNEWCLFFLRSSPEAAEPSGSFLKRKIPLSTLPLPLPLPLSVHPLPFLTHPLQLSELGEVAKCTAPDSRRAGHCTCCIVLDVQDGITNGKCVFSPNIFTLFRIKSRPYFRL